nr:RNA-directed DNA polymerase, eukaryota [Tanacetum cinerariifolium]
MIVMGDSNEVRTQDERYGSNFNAQGAAVFNSFISKGGLVDVPLGGYSFTWSQKSASKMNALLEKGDMSLKILEDRMTAMKKLQNLDKINSLERAQKAKINWSTEGDENLKYFHGIINKQRNKLVIGGILADGAWIEEPKDVKNELLSHFKDRFNVPSSSCFVLDMDFPHHLSMEQKNDLEIFVTNDEVKRAVWDCGSDKSLGLDGFTFSFYRRYSNEIEYDVVEAVNHFFTHGLFPRGDNFSFISVILKTQDAKQILDGPFILNELIRWCKDKKKQTMIFKVDFEKAFDFVRWDYLDDVLKKFGFGLRINMQKRILMGIAVDDSKVDIAAQNVGCMTLKLPFTYLGIKVGYLMTHIKSWEEINNKLHWRLLKWKLKTLSIGGWLTLLRSVLGLMPILHSRVIKVIHGEDGKIGNPKSGYPSNWIDIVRDISLLNDKGINLLGFIKKKVGNGGNTLFWEEVWKEDVPFKHIRPHSWLGLIQNSLDQGCFEEVESVGLCSCHTDIYTTGNTDSWKLKDDKEKLWKVRRLSKKRWQVFVVVYEFQLQGGDKALLVAQVGDVDAWYVAWLDTR